MEKYILYFRSGKLPLLLLMAFLFMPLVLTAQADTLRTVEVHGLRGLATEPGTKVELLDSSRINLTISRDLAQLLADATPVYFKNYGVSGLASVGLRGTSANHTALIWNGIKLQQPSLQQTDYSILPVIFWDDIGLQYGPTISLSGADVAGGAIHLVNHMPTHGFKAKIISQLGSFDYQQQALTIDYGKGRIYGKSQANYRTANNDFGYTLPSGEIVRQQNAAQKQCNFLQHLYYSTDKYTWKNIFWYGFNDRQLPRTITGHDNRMQDDQQEDIFYRFISNVSSGYKKVKWELGYSYLQQELLFKKLQGYIHEEAIYQDLQTNSIQHIMRGQWQYDVNDKLYVTGGGQVENSFVSTSSYEVDDRWRSDYYIKGTASYSGWKVHGGFKQIIVSGNNVPVIPSFGLEKDILNLEKVDLEISGKVVRHFRFPTFNDLFWNPGGNPDLKPEKGWSAESTASFIYSDGIVLSTAITYFNLQVEDWILWLPSNKNYWAPENMWKVNSRGIEASVKGVFTVSGLPVEGDFNYSFTRSSNEAYDGKQLMYVPLHMGNMLLQVTKGSWIISPSASYSGKRYTTQDNREEDSLPANMLLNISAGYHRSFNLFDAGLQFEVRNILNEAYQTMQNRAMPGRNYQLQLTINF